MDSTLLSAVIPVLGTLFGAILGASLTIFGTRKINKDNDKKYNCQVESISKETLDRANVYLSHMVMEEYEEFLANLEARVSGLKVIENLLSEFPLGTISTEQVFAVYRIREFLQEIIFDISLFQSNNIRVKQFVANIQFQISHGINRDAQELLDKEVEQAKKDLKNEYDLRLYKNLNEYIDQINTLKTHYYTIAQKISEKNK